MHFGKKIAEAKILEFRGLQIHNAVFSAKSKGVSVDGGI